MPEIQDQVLNLLQAMEGSASAETGQSFRTGVKPLPEQIEAAEVLKGAVDLTWITKDVRFGADGLEADLTDGTLDTAIIGGMPIPGLIVSGVPGLLGQLGGNLPLLNQFKLYVKAEVKWTVLDEDGEALEESQWKAPGGLEGPEILVLFAPEVVELTDSVTPPLPRMRKLRASVTLTVGDVSETRELPDVPVPVAPLLVPKVLACFVHSNFQASHDDDDGAVLLMLPSNSPIKDAGKLDATLHALQTAVGSLKDFADFAAFLVGLDTLVGAVGAQPHVRIAVANQVSDLNDITLIQNDLLTNDIEAEDEFSSMIFLGPSGAGVEVFCETGFSDENGEGLLVVGERFFTLVRSLHANKPSTVPADKWTTVKDPDHMVSSPDGFGDWISSLRFA